MEWSGADSTSVDIYRNKIKLVTTDDDGFHTDDTPRNGLAMLNDNGSIDSGFDPGELELEPSNASISVRVLQSNGKVILRVRLPTWMG